jgi:23S rRNA (cytosine1962-C5)-methyltransferase
MGSSPPERWAAVMMHLMREPGTTTDVPATDAGTTDAGDVRLVDAGGLRRLEWLGERLVDRPAPAATDWRRDVEAWSAADLRFDVGPGWSGASEATSPWLAHVAGLEMELRPSAAGGVGLYPEHASNIEWLEGQVRAAAAARGAQPMVLNLFAHTGLLTLVAARAGASVAHVDAARSTVAWARRNADRNDLGDRPIRWLVDDAMAFVGREARRARRYDGIVLDPPTFGRAGRREWHLEAALPDLVAACAEVATEDAFVLLTAHTTGLDGEALERVMATSFRAEGQRIETVELALDAESGARLALGWAVRLGA